LITKLFLTTPAKGASEAFLEKLAEKARLEVSVHRLIGIEPPIKNTLNALLWYSFMMKVRLQTNNVEGYFNFKDVNLVAVEIVKDVIEVKKKGRPEGVVFKHHTSGVKVPVMGSRSM